MLDSGYNPDILTCLANLSSDEVFTPPEMANEILDQLPPELWSDKDARFLDPACKSGVFLREITKRLDAGLEKAIPDRQERMNHIFANQLYGLSITELTSLLSRRSVYCSKAADGKYSVCEEFDSEQGNIIFNRVEHVWVKGRCAFCGASQKNYGRGEALETHAYQFIHAENPEEIFDMRFDVIVGNPPYQLSSNEMGIQAVPLYDKFVDQAKKLNPRYLVMIIPSRWFAGGMGMNAFRERMLNDGCIRELIDFPKSRDCFPGVDIAGGVCYFLWNRENPGSCLVTTKIGDKSIRRERELNEFKIFIRDNVGIDVIHKVLERGEKTMTGRVHSISPFGLPTSKRGLKTAKSNSVILVSSSGKSYISKDEVLKNADLIDRYKVSIGQLNPDRGGVNNALDGKMNVFTKIKIYQPGEVITATYLLLDHFKNLEQASNCSTYLKTSFVRFLVSLTLSSMHITKHSFQFVPIQDFSKSWSNEELYNLYNLTEDEINYIESMIRVMK